MTAQQIVEVQCPYCAEEIRADAVVCKHCHRDFFVLKPLMQENAAIKAELAALRDELATVKAASNYSEAIAEIVAVEGWLGKAIRWLGKALLFIVVFVVVPIAVLVGAHYLLVIKLDLSPILLRVVSIIIPASFGAAMAAKARAGLGAAFVVGALVGVSSVAAMLAAVSIVDNVPLTPANRREWQESIEYAGSILLATVTGALAGRLWQKLEAPAGSAGGHAEPGPESRTDRMMRVEMLITAVGAIATAVGSVIAGFRGTAE